ncbi:LysM peptidoglycan-binding domain-containing protein [Sagittula sp.]|uniref:LysM peptidoglycan-binding domain-containing protein n=1 Tax=Sagittula sp. TaxID=2038081 RepID=UPI00351959D5
MIRMVLFAIGFIAITVALIVVQPGAGRDVSEAAAAEPVTRTDLDLPTPATAEVPVVPMTPEATPAPAPQQQASLPQAEPAALSVTRAVSTPDDREMRRMTWSTLSSLNQATGRETAPGQPGSLLHAIVRRSLDGTPATAAEASGSTTPAGGPQVYVVVSGDSLVSIAEKIYGDVNMTGPLFTANRSIMSRPDDLRPGQTLVLPKK